MCVECVCVCVCGVCICVGVCVCVCLDVSNRTRLIPKYQAPHVDLRWLITKLCCSTDNLWGDKVWRLADGGKELLAGHFICETKTANLNDIV